MAQVLSIAKYNRSDSFFSSFYNLLIFLKLKEEIRDKVLFKKAINNLIPLLNEILKIYNIKPLKSHAVNEIKIHILPALSNYIEIQCNNYCDNKSMPGGEKYYTSNILRLLAHLLGCLNIPEWKKYGFEPVDFDTDLLLRVICRYCYENNYMHKNEVWQCLMNSTKNFVPEWQENLNWLKDNQTNINGEKI